MFQIWELSQEFVRHCPGTTLGHVLLYGKWQHLAGSSILCNWPCVVVSARKNFGSSPKNCIGFKLSEKK